MTVATLMKPVGPKAEAFAFDKRLITGIMGPVGSAKTTTCIRKMIHGALWQRPGPDGVYRAKWGVIRDTYPQLKKTALASWFAWFPKKVGKWSGEAPFEHNVRFKVVVGPPFVPVRQAVTVELSVIFAAIGEHKAEDVMRGWEVTGIWMNEGDLVSQEVFAYAVTRVGRYPSANQGGCHWRGLILDMNAPDVDNWTYETFVDQDLGIDDELMIELRAELGEQFGIGFYVQPGGRSKDPKPENIENLPKGYYAQQVFALSKKPHLLRRMVDNLFGPVRKGQPVFPEYQDELHCRDVPPIKGVPIRLAVDAGNTPAAVFGQRDSNGQVRILSEVVIFAESEEDEISQIGGTAFGKMVGNAFLDRYGDFYELAEIGWCDPAGSAGEGAEAADASWRQNFQKGLREALGRTDIKIRPSSVPGNGLDKRLEAVRGPMLRLVEGGKPGLVIANDNCKILRRGFKGAYIYKRTSMATGSGRYEYKPVKDDYSHVQDAAQYLCWGLTRHGNGDAASAGRQHPGEKRGNGRRAIRVERDYDIHRGRVRA